jgi:hypothetical protein
VRAALQLAGKLRRRGQLNAVLPGELLHVTDTPACLQFLVDTGAAFSCIPRTSPLPGLEQLPRLKAAGGQSIQCFGKVAAEVCFGGHRFKWTFLYAAVEEPLLGGDFLKHYKLVVDLSNKCLFDAVSRQRVVVGDLAEAGGLAALHSTPSPQLQDLLKQFPDVLSETGKLPAVKHVVKHSIVTTGRPVTVKFRWLDAAKLAAAKKEFLQLEADGIICRSCSAWASPLHMVLQKDRAWRPCGDYRLLNEATVPDQYPLPNIDSATEQTGTSTFP